MAMELPEKHLFWQADLPAKNPAGKYVSRHFSLPAPM
jgi:hypothetical protein